MRISARDAEQQQEEKARLKQRDKCFSSQSQKVFCDTAWAAASSCFSILLVLPSLHVQADRNSCRMFLYHRQWRAGRSSSLAAGNASRIQTAAALGRCLKGRKRPLAVVELHHSQAKQKDVDFQGNDNPPHYRLSF
jgi:hypothetical protein